MSIVLAIDGMGGDHAPEMIIEGMAKAVMRFPHIRFELFGDEERISPLLGKHESLVAVTHFHPTTEVITSDAKPTAAIRGFKDSSLRRAILSVREGCASGVVSAGNTGAYMALSRLVLGTLPGIDRPAIGGLMPTFNGPKVMLDMGANVEVSAENLIEFAIMGVAFARVVLGIQDPSVGLLNIGTEELKGNPTIKLAHQALKESAFIPNFKGFIEGDSISQGIVDVTVADGFAGNICLKTAEGTGKLMGHFLREGIKRSLLSKLGVLLAKPAFDYLRDKIDPRHYNGAPFLGLQGVAVKSHGGTDGEGFLQAISVALHMIEKNINASISQEILAFSSSNSTEERTKVKFCAL
ncbi:MAG: phosphate acyltransferase PlsX [Caedimonas sp.]|nr:phosphate acyltransferase PlsX [Caedimonas sp.]